MGCRARRTRRRVGRRAARLLLLVVATTALALPATGAGASTSVHPVTTPPPPEESPFSGADAFCTHADPPAATELTASMPGVTPGTVDAALLTPTTAAAAAGSRFAELVNACGGIQGRRLVLHPVVTTGNPTSDCAALVATGAPVAAATTPTALDDCVRANPGLVLVMPAAAAPNGVLATTHGRFFVGTADEGPLDARVEDLVDHEDLGSSPFAVITGGDDQVPPFGDALGAVLASHALRPVLGLAGATSDTARQLRRARVAAVLTDHLDPDLLRGLAARSDPPTTYLMTGSLPTPAELKATLGTPVADGTTGLRVQSWIDPGAAAAAAGLAPSQLAVHCAAWAATSVAGTRATTTSTTTTAPAGSDEALTSACQAMRVLTRGLYLAGPNPTQRDLVRALHNLPNTDRTAADGTPAARPNQLVNEPVRRVATVVVRAELSSCPPAADRSRATTTTASSGSSPGAATSWCWVPVSGYGDGGRAVETKLTAGTTTP